MTQLAGGRMVSSFGRIRMRGIAFSLILLNLIAASSFAQQLAQSEVPLFDGIGKYSRKIQTQHPKAQEFFDQGLMYSKGLFKDVLFYKEDVMKKAERTYHPGE